MDECLIYLGEVIIFSQSFDTYLRDVDMVLFTVREADVSLNLKKCCLITDSIKFREHIIEPVAIISDDVRGKCLSQLQHNRNVTEQRSFLELRNPYWRFVPSYDNNAAQLAKALRKKIPKDLPILDVRESDSYDKLIQTILSKTVLALPRSDLLFEIDADASHN